MMLRRALNIQLLHVRCLASAVNPIVFSRQCELGQQIFQAFAVKSFMDSRPHWSVSQINDVAQGIAQNCLLNSKFLQHSQSFDDTTDSQSLFARLGELHVTGDDVGVEERLLQLESDCLLNISDTEIISIMKSMHAKALLHKICTDAGKKIFVSVSSLEDCYKACVLCDGVLLSEIVHAKCDIAERLACFKTLCDHFAKEMKREEVAALPLESDFDLGSGDLHLRVMALDKKSDEGFGFTVRGGEQRVIKNKEYVQLHIVTPVFISDVAEGSAAERCGLRVGDVLIAINDHSLKNSIHKQAVRDIQKFRERERVLFTVKHDMNERLKYEVEQKFYEKERKLVRNELNSGAMRIWHEAKSKKDPEAYFTETFVHKKKRFTPNNRRASLRLWDKYGS